MKNYRHYKVGKILNKKKLNWLNLISVLIILCALQTASSVYFTPLRYLPGKYIE